MRKSTVIFLFLFLATHARAFSQARSGAIRGKVIDAVTMAPVDFAVVKLTSAGQPPKSAMSEQGGTFAFGKLPFGDYTLTISFIGYLTDTLSQIALRAETPLVQLKPITLKPNSQLLGEVTVVEEKPTVEYGADRITFNAGQTLIAEGSVATDLLKNVPMVDVDIDGRATIAGKRNTRIFIDGKPSDFAASNIADLLNVLPSDAIEKIEVITSPPAKYSADGEGIINIELKKGYKIGLNGNVSVTGTSRGNYNGSGYLAYRSRNLTLSSNFGYRENFRRSTGSSYRETFTKDTTYYINQFNQNRGRNGGRNFRTSLDWDINPFNNLRISTNINANKNRGNTLTNYHYINESRETQSLRNQANENAGRSSNSVVNLDYVLKMRRNKDEKLTVGLNYFGNGASNDRHYERSFLLADGTPSGTDPTLQHNDNETENRGLEVSLDYDKPFKGSGNSFEAGLKSNFRTNQHDQFSELFDFGQQAYVPNEALIGNFEYREGLHAAYASIRARTKNNWGFRAGGRAELTDVRIRTATKDYTLQPYLNFFPSVAINRFFNKKYNLGITYNMRINRPRENALNPQVENADPINISYGNPNLKPSFTHQVDLSFGTYHDKWSLSPRVGFSNTEGIIERLRTVGEDGISRTTYQNMASSKAFSFNLSGNYRPTKKISSNAGLTVSKVTYESDNRSGLRRDGISFRSNCGFSIQLPKRLAFESNINYYSNTAAQGRDKGSVTTSFSGRKSLLNNRLNVRISAVDPFYQRTNSIFTEGQNFRLQSSSVVASRNFSLTLNYRFTKVGRNNLGKTKRDRSGLDES